MPQTLTPTLTDTIQAYADHGYILTPLKGKIALVRGWPKTAYDPFPDLPQGNFGVVLQPDDIVIDVDPRNFPEGRNPYTELEEVFPDLKNGSFTVRTGSGGLHIYFKKPADHPIKGGLKAFPGVEFKTAGQYVVGAASIHPDTGMPYIIEVPITALRPAPLELLTLLKRETVLKEQGVKAYVTDDQTRKRYIQYLKSAPIAVEGQAGDKATFATAAYGHDLGLHPDSVLELLLEHYNPNCEPPWEPEALKKKVYNAYQYTEGNLGHTNPQIIFKDVEVLDATKIKWDRYESGKLKPTLKNTINAFMTQNSLLLGALGFNEFTNDIIFLKQAPWHTETEAPGPWSDNEAIRCKEYLANADIFEGKGFEPPTNIIHEAALAVSHKIRVHPVRNYLDLVKWDGHKRVHTWVQKYLGVEDNDYTRSVGMKVLIAAVSRIYEPGCKFDYIPVFEGKQGLGKSRALAILGGRYFSDQVLDVHSRDTVDSMRGKWLIEVSEMEAHYRSETQAMKSFLSRPTDRARLAYARTTKDFPRQCIFIGTYNPEEDEDIGYLKDTTGNRRYWPIRLTRIDIEALKKVRDQLWAEAVVLYKKGTPVYLEDAKIEEMAKAEQKKRLGRDPWTDKIQDWLNVHPYGKEQLVITGAEIFTECLSGRMQLYTRREMSRISNVMHEIGWEKGVHYSEKTKETVRGYRRPVIE